MSVCAGGCPARDEILGGEETACHLQFHEGKLVRGDEPVEIRGLADEHVGCGGQRQEEAGQQRQGRGQRARHLGSRAGRGAVI